MGKGDPSAAYIEKEGFTLEMNEISGKPIKIALCEK